MTSHVRSIRSLAGALSLSLAAVLASGCASIGNRCGEVRRLPALAAEEIDASLFLVGDAGEPEDEDGERRMDPVLRSLTPRVAAAVERLGGDRVGVAYLGDNLYKRGLSPRLSPEKVGPATRQLADQLTAAAGAKTFLVPGNHDWDNACRRGLEAIQAQEAFVASWAAEHGADARVAPVAGCPEPLAVPFGEHLLAIFVDSQWWLHLSGERTIAGCPLTDEAEYMARLEAALAAAGDRQAVILAHHPLASGGPHGGHFSVRQWLLPPVLEPLLRWLGSTQDLHGGVWRGRRYQSLRAGIAGLPAELQPLAWIAGHEHSLQLLDGAGTGAAHQIVSGTGSWDHSSGLHCLDSHRFGSTAAGYMRLDVTREGRIRLGVFELAEEDEPLRETFSVWLR